MKIKYKILASLLIVGGLSLQSCDSVFDELSVNPNQPSMKTYFTTPEGVNDAVTTMYGYISTQRCLGASGSKTQIIRGDEANSNSDYGKPGMFGEDLNSSFYTIEQPYTLMYTTASQASYIIEEAPKVDFSGNEKLRNAYIGEAHFWRAFAHYYLLTNFRQVSPIRQMPRGAEDYVRKPESPEAVWDFIKEDLERAKELLPEKGYWTGDNTGRVSKAALLRCRASATCTAQVSRSITVPAPRLTTKRLPRSLTRLSRATSVHTSWHQTIHGTST